MAEPGRMEVPADPSCPGPTKLRMPQVPAPVPASSKAVLVFPVGAHTHAQRTHVPGHTDPPQSESDAGTSTHADASSTHTNMKRADGTMLLLFFCHERTETHSNGIYTQTICFSSAAGWSICAQSIWLLALRPWSSPVAGPWTYESLRAHSSLWHSDLLSCSPCSLQMFSHAQNSAPTWKTLRNRI